MYQPCLLVMVHVYVFLTWGEGKLGMFFVGQQAFCLLFFRFAHRGRAITGACSEHARAAGGNSCQDYGSQTRTGSAIIPRKLCKVLTKEETENFREQIRVFETRILSTVKVGESQESGAGGTEHYGICRRISDSFSIEVSEIKTNVRKKLAIGKGVW